MEGNFGMVALYIGCAVGADLLLKGVKYGYKFLKNVGKSLVEDVVKDIGLKSAKEIAEDVIERGGVKVLRSYDDE